MVKWKENEYADSIKQNILKGGNMAKKEEIEDDDYEDIAEEEEEIIEEKPQPKFKPKPIAAKPNQQRFVGVHQEALEAVLDNQTNRAQANIFEILVDILNRLEEVKKAVGA